MLLPRRTRVSPALKPRPTTAGAPTAAAAASAVSRTGAVSSPVWAIDTESSNGPKLYFELRANGRPLDPMPYLRK